MWSAGQFEPQIQTYFISANNTYEILICFIINNHIFVTKLIFIIILLRIIVFP